jgi:hypothetical protein
MEVHEALVASDLDDRRRRAGAVLVPLACYAFTTLVVLLGVIFGRALLRPSPLSHDGQGPGSVRDSFVVWDGGWYGTILQDGYSYNPTGESTFAFFPAYPMLARAVGWITRLGTNWALLATSHLCLIFALIVLYRYARLRMREDAPAQLAVASAALVPTTFFFRMAYAESLLFLIVVLVLFGIARNWPAYVLALLVGLGTAARPSGGALLFPLALFLLPKGEDRPFRIARLGWLLVGCWGILAFMAFGWLSFGDPIAFVHAQSKWHVRPHVPLGEKVLAVLTFGAIRGVYSESSPFYWRTFLRMGPSVFNLYFANPIYFAGTILAVATGAVKGWLNRFEVALAVALVAVPYLAHNYETTMMATGRYMTTVVPTYLVLGYLLRRLPIAVTVGLAALSAFLLGAYSAMFGMGYWLI